MEGTDLVSLDLSRGFLFPEQSSLSTLEEEMAFMSNVDLFARCEHCISHRGKMLSACWLFSICDAIIMYRFQLLNLFTILPSVCHCFRSIEIRFTMYLFLSFVHSLGDSGGNKYMGKSVYHFTFRMPLLS